MSQDKPVTVVVGVGPGLGGALAERFAREGHSTALLSRSEDSRHETAERIARAGGRAYGFDCDVTEAASVAAAFGRIREELGNPGVLLYNAGLFAMGGLLDLDPALFETAWKANCLGGFLTAREVLPAMIQDGTGSILFTGATAGLRSSAGFSGFAVGKFGLRALAQGMAREFGPRGIHVAHIVIDGMIDTPTVRKHFPDRGKETLLAPEAIAEQYWQLHVQPRTAWTQELDLRPFGERF